MQFLDLATPDSWTELQSFMTEMGAAAPYWRTQSTSGDLHPARGWDADWAYRFRLGVYTYLEWCELTPRPDDGGLTLDDIRQVCAAIGFEVEVQPDRVRVLGYRRLT